MKMRIRPPWPIFFLAPLLLVGACSQSRLIGAERDDPSVGAGGNTSSGVDGGLAVAAPLAPIDPAAAARVAVLLRSCGDADSIEVILDRFYTQIPGPDDAKGRLAWAISCIDAAPKGCAGVQQCIGLAATTNAACAPGCDGTVLHTCDGNTQVDIDCAKLGLTCSPKSERCLAVPLGPSCDQNVYPNTCKGTSPEGCLATVVHGPDCASLGLGCGFVDGFTNALCVGEGPACAAAAADMSFFAVRLDTGVACDGDTLRACVNRSEHKVDCGTRGAGFKCQVGDPGVSGTGGGGGGAPQNAYCGLAVECVPGVDASVCDPQNGTITVCNAGRRDVVSCAELGFSGGCDEKRGCLLQP
ncbi:Hypothetical protein A7982_06590 [Minicystis rosea]|nr:Hypothetical protein A7982_06590 [Minicystis rosea]